MWPPFGERPYPTGPDRFGPGVARPEAIKLDAPAKNGQRHILCINNDFAVLALFRDLLQEEGYRVSTRAYVDHDLKTINDLAPDLIVLDYMWSTEDASWSLLQLLRMGPGTASIPIVLCTGAVREVEALQIHLFEVDLRVVYKPFNIDHLNAAVSRSFALAAAGDRGDR